MSERVRASTAACCSGVRPAETLGGAGEFGLADALGVLLQGEDGGDGVADVEALLVLVDLFGDDGLGLFGLAAAVGEVGLGDLMEVVDVVDEAAFDLVHAGVDVAGDGDVDEEHRAVATALEHVLAVGAAEDLLRGAGGADDDVGAVGLGVELLEGQDLGGAGGAAELGGEALGAGLGAVGDDEIGGAVLDEVAGGELGHLAGADEQDGFSGQGAEDLAGEVDGDRGDGDAGGADLGLGADALGDGEGALEQAFEGAGDGTDLAGDGVGLLDLAEDLGLADDHGVERAGDAEEVADGVALAELVEVRGEGGEGDAEELFEEAGEALEVAALSEVWASGLSRDSWKVRSSMRLQVERMRPSRMPGWWTRLRVASARREAGTERRSRTSMGAVL